MMSALRGPVAGGGGPGNVVGFPGGGGVGPPPMAGPPAALAAGGIPGGSPGPPMPGMGVPPGLMLNPDFLQWQQMSQAWAAERAQRQAQFAAACALVRVDAAQGYRIDIEADSTVAADEEAEKLARTEFLQSVIPMLQLLVPQAQQNPGAVPLIHALVMFGVRAFPAARSLEQQFEEAFRTLVQSPPPPPPPKGNVKPPEEVMSEHQIAMGDQAVDAQKVQVEAQKVELARQKLGVDLWQANIKAQGAQQQQQQETALKSVELAQQGQELESRQALERARLTHLALRDAGGLV